MEDIIGNFYKKIDGCSARSLARIEYAFYLTMDLEDLCTYFFIYLANTDIRNKLLRHIKNKAQSGSGAIPYWFLEKLLSEFPSSVGRRRISVGTVIKELGYYYTPDDLRDFFRSQICSESILDRKRAYHISELCYNDDIENLLIKAWKKFGDEGSVSVLVKIGSTQKIVDVFKEIWKSENVKFYIKNQALKKVACFDFSRVRYLKEESPVSFLSASIAAGLNVEDDFILSTARSTNSINELGYILWCAGKLAKRDVIFKLVSEIESMEEKLPLEFWEPEFYGLA